MTVIGTIEMVVDNVVVWVVCIMSIRSALGLESQKLLIVGIPLGQVCL